MPLVVVLLLILPGCVVSSYCFDDNECSSQQQCNAEGRCEPRTGPPPDVGVRSDSRPEIRCPLPGMVKAADRFCIDIYEASRADATATSAGVDGSRATSREGVVPWQVLSNEEAELACQAAGKRLCTPTEWLTACQGPEKTVYAYGDSYNETICNGIDTYPEWQFKLMPTGSFLDCTNDYGVFDMNGNVWEHTANGSNKTIRGGAYNCSDSKTLHRCDYIPGNWEPSARGFRCCADGVPITEDAGPPDSAGPDAAGPDAAGPDAAGPDAAGLDSALLDAGPPDSAPPGE